MPKVKLVPAILIIFTVVSYSICLAASQIEVSATVDKAEISLDDLVQFTINIEGMDSSFGNPKIKLPKLQDNFDMVATSQSNNISLISGKTKVSWQLQYTLSPKKEGQIQIDSAEIIYQGATYKTKEIVITVTPSKAPQKIPQETYPKKVPRSEEGILI